MGSIFRYVADDSLEAHRSDDPCPLCGARGNVHSFFATPDGGAITEACVQCISTLPLEQIFRWQSERRAMDHLRVMFPQMEKPQLEARHAAICRELRRTPRVPPFCQDDEWPLCCGEFAEYVGRPGLPEGWNDFGGLSLFRCGHCGQGLEVFQHT
jgi:hypothetical protein